MKLHEYGTHNNPALKIVFSVLFIIFPIIGFVIGIQYQVLIDKNNLNETKNITLEPTPKYKGEGILDPKSTKEEAKPIIKPMGDIALVAELVSQTYKLFDNKFDFNTNMERYGSNEYYFYSPRLEEKELQKEMLEKVRSALTNNGFKFLGQNDIGVRGGGSKDSCKVDTTCKFYYGKYNVSCRVIADFDGWNSMAVYCFQK